MVLAFYKRITGIVAIKNHYRSLIVFSIFMAVAIKQHKGNVFLTVKGPSYKLAAHIYHGIETAYLPGALGSRTVNH